MSGKILDLRVIYQDEPTLYIIKINENNDLEHEFIKNFNYNFYLMIAPFEFKYFYSLNDLKANADLYDLYEIILPYKYFSKIKQFVDAFNKKSVNNIEYFKKFFYNALKYDKDFNSMQIYRYDFGTSKINKHQYDVRKFFENLFYIFTTEDKNLYILSDFKPEHKYAIKNEVVKDNVNIGFVDIEIVSNQFPTYNDKITSISLVCYNTNTTNVYKVLYYMLVDKNFANYNKEFADEILEKIKQEFPNVNEYAHMSKYLCIINGDFEYKVFYDEGEMLDAFASDLLKNKVHLLSGWNITNFDLPFIFYRALENSSKAVDVIFKFPDIVEKEIKGAEDKNLNVNLTGIHKFYSYGIPHLDYQLLLQSSYLQMHATSYKLDNIAKEVLKYENNYNIKLEIKSFVDTYKNNLRYFVLYNVLDALIVAFIENVLRNISLIFMLRDLTYTSLYNLKINDVVDCYFYKQLKKNHLIISLVNAENINKTLFNIYKKVNRY